MFQSILNTEEFKDIKLVKFDDLYTQIIFEDGGSVTLDDEGCVLQTTVKYFKLSKYKKNAKNIAIALKFMKRITK